MKGSSPFGSHLAGALDRHGSRLLRPDRWVGVRGEDTRPPTAPCGGRRAPKAVRGGTCSEAGFIVLGPVPPSEPSSAPTPTPRAAPAGGRGPHQLPVAAVTSDHELGGWKARADWLPSGPGGQSSETRCRGVWPACPWPRLGSRGASCLARLPLHLKRAPPAEAAWGFTAGHHRPLSLLPPRERSLMVTRGPPTQSRATPGSGV